MHLLFDDISKSQSINKQIKKPVAILFYADWCPHCVEVKPHWNKVASKLGNKVTMLSVRDDFIQHLDHKYTLNGYPTILISKNGKEVKSFQEQRTPENIHNFIKKNLIRKSKRRKSKRRKSKRRKSSRRK